MPIIGSIGASHGRRRIPLAGERVELRDVEAHCQVEWPLRRGKPVGLFVLSWALVLEVEVERAVRIVLEWHPATNGETVEAVGDLKALRVVKRDGPKGIHRRRSAFLETNRV